MASLADYPQIRTNSNRFAFDEDCKHIVLAGLPLRMAHMYFRDWHAAGALTEEQAAMMFMMLNERTAREEAKKDRR